MRRVTVAILFLGLIAVVGGLEKADSARATRSGEVDVLLLVTNSYGANYNLIRDVMEKYGWNLTTVGVTDTVTQCYYGGPIIVDLTVSEVTDVSEYDVLAIMPATGWRGNSHDQLLGSPEAIALVAQAVQEDLLVAAFCGGTRVLAAADVINGVLVTGHDHETYLAEYAAAGAIFVGNPAPPTQDGNIVTCVRNQTNSALVCEIMRTTIDSLRTARSLK